MRITLIRELLRSYRAIDDKTAWRRIWRESAVEARRTHPLRHWLAVTFMVVSLASMVTCAVLGRLSFIDDVFAVAQLPLLGMCLIVGNSMMVKIDDIAANRIQSVTQQSPGE